MENGGNLWKMLKMVKIDGKRLKMMENGGN